MTATPITPPRGMAECPQCDPCSPEMDEDGRPYSCYCCGDTGWITLAAREEMQRHEEEAERELVRKNTQVCPSLCSHGRGFNCRTCWPTPAPTVSRVDDWSDYVPF